MARVSQSRSGVQHKNSEDAYQKNLSFVEGAQKGYTNLGPEHFLHGRMGPWPQPSPAHPIGEAPAVIHLPWKEKLDWWLWIGSRYVATLAYSPIAYLRSIFRPGLAEVSDQEFTMMLQDSMLSKFITPKFDHRDIEIFKEQMVTGQNYFIVDLEAVKVVNTFDGIYCSGTKTLLLEKSKNEYEVLSIWVDKTSTLLFPNDGDAWELAKYFVLQGGALCATLVVHPLLHFPLDAINAITKTAVPKDHILFKLIYPHTRFTLPLENAVLTYKTSLLQGKWWMTYAPYPGDAKGLRELLVQGYMGIKGNDSYEPFKYPLIPKKVWSKYGEFQDQYYQAFYDFVSVVLKDISKDDYFVASWAKWISQNVPGFPNEKEIFEGDNLVKAVAFYMWDVTVGHTVDHYNYGEMDVRKIPLRLRQAPPRKGDKMMSRKKLVKFWDTGKYIMAQILFYRPTTVTKLMDTEYNFENSEHSSAAEKFFTTLRELDKKFEKTGMRYIPLEKIARSIQS
ncbi:MAG: hypothetical protein Fur0010_25110 [Bdellovibrio sp.]